MVAKRRRTKLVAARKAAGYTQEGLAAALYVDRATVINWEAGRHIPQPYLWPKLARLLGVTKERLQDLLADAPIPQAKSNDRMSYVLEHPTSIDLVAVAYLHERIRQLDEEYDRAPSTALLGPAAQAHGQVRLLRENAASPRIRKALFEVEAESATFMAQLVWDVSQRRDHMAPVTYLDEAVAAAQQVHDPRAEAYATLR